MGGAPPGHHGDAARVLTIDLEELTWALNSRDPLGESSHWLNLESGTILSVIGPDVVEESDEDPRDDDRWLFIEPIESSEAFRVMEDFVEQCGDDHTNLESAGAALSAALQHPPQLRDDDADVRHDAGVMHDTTGALRRHAVEYPRPLAGRGAKRRGDGPARSVASARFIPGFVPEQAPLAGGASLTAEGS